MGSLSPHVIIAVILMARTTWGRSGWNLIQWCPFTLLPLLSRELSCRVRRLGPPRRARGCCSYILDPLTFSAPLQERHGFYNMGPTSKSRVCFPSACQATRWRQQKDMSFGKSASARSLRRGPPLRSKTFSTASDDAAWSTVSLSPISRSLTSFHISEHKSRCCFIASHLTKPMLPSSQIHPTSTHTVVTQ